MNKKQIIELYITRNVLILNTILIGNTIIPTTDKVIFN